MGWLRKSRNISFSEFGQDALLSTEVMELRAKRIHVQFQEGGANVKRGRLEDDEWENVLMLVVRRFRADL